MVALPRYRAQSGKRAISLSTRRSSNGGAHVSLHLRAIKGGGLANAPTVDWLSAEIVFSPIDMDAGFVQV